MDMAYITFQNAFNSEEMTHIHLHNLDRANIHRIFITVIYFIEKLTKVLKSMVFCSIKCPRGVVIGESS